VPDRDDVTLVEGPLFRLDQIEMWPNEGVAMRYAGGPLQVIPRRGSAHIGQEAIPLGGYQLAEGIDHIAFDENGICLIAQPLGA
jgi:mannose-6-phosphate isomerase